MERIVLNTKVVSVDKIKPNKWNPNKQTDFMFEKEMNSITTNGFIVPIVVRSNGKEEYEIIDGEHRLKAAKKLGFEEVSINDLGKVTDAQAKKLTIILNELRGEYDNLELAGLMKDLSGELDVTELYKDLPFEQDEIDSLIKLKDFDWSQFDKPEGSEQGQDAEFTKLEFILTIEQAEVIESAIHRIIEALNLEGATRRARALELIAADSLNTPLESYQ